MFVGTWADALFLLIPDCTPYLLQLGLTKSKTSLVWIAGPLSGLIIQPLIGVIADRSRSKWGRRRPFMVFGSFVVALCLIVLGWTAEIVGLFVTDPEKVPMLILL
jgi:solute carrier family 45 protein 1/2/4